MVLNHEKMGVCAHLNYRLNEACAQFDLVHDTERVQLHGQIGRNLTRVFCVTYGQIGQSNYKCEMGWPREAQGL